MHYRVFVVLPLLSGMTQALVRRYPAGSVYSSMASSVVSGAIPTSNFANTSMAYTSLLSNTPIPSAADGCAPYAYGTGSVQLTCYSTGISEYTPSIQNKMPLCYSTIPGSFNSAGLPVAPTVMPCFTMSGNIGPAPSVQTTAW